MGNEHIRNVVLVGHTGTGKTSLAEALVYRAGVIPRLGSVDRGNTILDTDPEERDRHQTLGLAVTRFEWADHTVNLIDTPGAADFIGEALLGLHAADLAVFVIDAVAGVQSQDRVLWRHAERLHMPRMVFINKLDRDHASFERTLAEVRRFFGSHADPVELPIGEESSFHGITDLLTDHAFVYDSGQATETDIPAELADVEHAEHEHLIEEVVEGDDAALEAYLDGEEPPPEQLEALLHQAVDEARVHPVLCGSATMPIGADHLLDFLCRVGPGPADVPPARIAVGETETDVRPDPAGQPLAFVFKTHIDEFLGQISWLRVVSGTIRSDDMLVNSRSRSKERLHQLMVFTGGGHQLVNKAIAGDLVAATKLGDTATGDTLAPESQPVRVVGPPRPSPVYGVVIQARSPAHEDKLANALHRLKAEDPSLSVSHDDATRQTVLSGGGETQIQVALSRIARLGVAVDTEDVRVAYRETLAGPAEVQGRYKKQTGGHGQFGIATVRFEPLERGEGFAFDSQVTGGAIPKNLIPAVGAGVEEAMARGGRYGFPVVDIKATCLDGKHHPVDSSEMSFKMAGMLALKEAIEAAGVEVLEPYSEIWIHVPNEHQGDVLGDLNARRGQVLGTESDGPDTATVHGLVPTSEIVRYVIDLRSMTGGAGSFSVEHHSYRPLPAAMIDNVVADQPVTS